ncbi:MAG: Uma2 family endonuclease [Chloroflexota bacterium]|nr:Uma2 family endonuclease [Chloroflexota bacterium]
MSDYRAIMPAQASNIGKKGDVKSMAVSLARKLWSVDEYKRMIEKGILGKDNRVELIKGDIIETAPIGIRHAACVVALEEMFHQLVDRTITVSVQNLMLLPDHS